MFHGSKTGPCVPSVPGLIQNVLQPEQFRGVSSPHASSKAGFPILSTISSCKEQGFWLQRGAEGSSYMLGKAHLQKTTIN